MMIKIIGSVMIVSGSYCMGRVLILKRKKRLEELRTIFELFKNYEVQLKEYRRSLDEALKDKGKQADMIIAGEVIEGLSREDKEYLAKSVNQLRTLPYRESLSVCHDLLEYLSLNIKREEEEYATVGKALPLVAGAMGVLVAILLF